MENGPSVGSEVGAKDVRQTYLEQYRGAMANNEAGKQVVEYNTQTFEVALSRLITRTSGDPEIVNAVRDLVNNLDWTSRLGDENEMMSSGATKNVAEAIRTTAETLRSQRIA